MTKNDLLNFLADCDLKIDYDAGTNSIGRQVDCSTFHISGPLRALETLIEAAGMKRHHYDESIDDLIQREIEA